LWTSQTWLLPSTAWNFQIDCVLFLLRALLRALHLLFQIWLLLPLTFKRILLAGISGKKTAFNQILFLTVSYGIYVPHIWILCSPIKSGVDAKELFHLYIVLWIEDKRRMLLENCRLDKVGAILCYWYVWMLPQNRFLARKNDLNLDSGQSAFVEHRLSCAYWCLRIWNDPLAFPTWWGWCYLYPLSSSIRLW
jgi:hypothetical protein